MDPLPILVVFADHAGCAWLRFLRRGFRHCFVVLRAGSVWLACEPLKDRIELDVLRLPPEFDLAAFYGAQGHRVLQGRRPPPRPRRPFVPAPLTCVTVVKRLLGIRRALGVDAVAAVRPSDRARGGLSRLVKVDPPVGDARRQSDRRRSALTAWLVYRYIVLQPIAFLALSSTAQAVVVVASSPAEKVFMGDLSLDAVWSRYQRAKQRRRCWESLWRECYIHALPQRGAGFGSEFRPGANPVDRLFDGTALDGRRAARRFPARRTDAALVAVVRPDARARS